MGGSSATRNYWNSEAHSNPRVPQSQRVYGGSEGFGGDGEISSTSSERRRRVVLCDCGVETPLVTTWTGANRGRRFYGCGLFEVNRKKVCNFFQWHDRDDNAREKNMIVGLTHKIEELKKKQIVLVGCVLMSMFTNIVLFVAYVRK